MRIKRVSSWMEESGSFLPNNDSGDGQIEKPEHAELMAWIETRCPKILILHGSMEAGACAFMRQLTANNNMSVREVSFERLNEVYPTLKLEQYAPLKFKQASACEDVLAINIYVLEELKSALDYVVNHPPLQSSVVFFLHCSSIKGVRSLIKTLNAGRQVKLIKIDCSNDISIGLKDKNADIFQKLGHLLYRKGGDWRSGRFFRVGHCQDAAC